MALTIQFTDEIVNRIINYDSNSNSIMYISMANKGNMANMIMAENPDYSLLCFYYSLILKDIKSEVEKAQKAEDEAVKIEDIFIDKKLLDNLDPVTCYPVQQHAAGELK